MKDCNESAKLYVLRWAYLGHSRDIACLILPLHSAMHAGDKIKFTPKFSPHQNHRDLMPKSLQAVIDDEGRMADY